MTPEVFAKTIISIEHNYGLKLDARSVWLKMDAIACGKGWVGTKPGCKRGGKIGENAIGKVPQRIKAAPIQPSSEKKVGAACGKGWEGTKPGCKRIKKGSKPEPYEAKKLKAEPKTETEKRTHGSHNDIPDLDDPANTSADQASAIQKLTGMSEKKVKDSIIAITGYTSSSYTSIRNVQRGIFKSEKGIPLTKAEISEVQSSIKSIDQYVKKMPAFDGMIHRGISFKSKEQQESFLSQISGGYSLEAMSSFSSSQSQAEGFVKSAGLNSHGILFTVKNKSGASIKQLSSTKDENEVLVPKDTKYRIVGNPKRSGNLVVVQMEEF